MATITNAKDLIKLRELHNSKIENLWCERQQEDIQQMINLMENVATAAMTCCNGNGPMAMDLLKLAKNEFIEYLLSASERYRHISSPKERHGEVDKLFA